MKRFSWRFKLIALFTLVLGASLLFQIFYVIPNIRNQEIDKTKKLQEEIAQNIVRELDVDILQTYDRLMNIAGRAEFRNMNIVVQQSTMTTIAKGSYRFEVLSLMKADGMLVASTAEYFFAHTNMSYADSLFFAVPLEQGEPYFAPPRYYDSEKLVGVSVSIPIESESGERVGVLIGLFRLNHLISRVLNLPSQEQYVIFMVDRQGTIIAHSEIDLFALEQGPLSLNFSDMPLVQDIIAGESGGSREFKHDGTPYFGTYAILESSAWGVVVEAPMNTILAKSNVLASRLLLVDLLFFAVALLVTLIFTHQITASQTRMENRLRESEDKFRTIFEKASDGILVADVKTKKFVLANAIMCKITGYSLQELLELDITDIHLKKDLPNVLEQFKKLAEKKITLAKDIPVLRKDKKIVYCDISSKPTKIGKQEVLIGLFRDITERKKADKKIKVSLKEKEILLREIHHRVKNNMQVISSLLNLQSRYIKNKSVLKIFKNSQNRIKSMAFIHENLYESRDLSRVNLTKYVKDLTNQLFRTYLINKENVKLAVKIKDVLLDVNTTIPCGLIINELVSNSLKYGFVKPLKTRKPEIRIEFRKDNTDNLKLIISDNGIGFPEDLDFQNTESLGLQLVCTLVEQLNGKIKLNRKKGTTFTIKFKSMR